MNKLTKRNVIHGLNRAKNFVCNAYHTTKNFLGNIDNAVRLLKAVYGALSPMVASYGGAGVTKNIMKTLSGYDNIQHQVMNVDNDIDAVRNMQAKKIFSLISPHK